MMGNCPKCGNKHDDSMQAKRRPYISITLRKYSGRDETHCGQTTEHVLMFCVGCIDSAPAFVTVSLDYLLSAIKEPETQLTMPDKDRLKLAIAAGGTSEANH